MLLQIWTALHQKHSQFLVNSCFSCKSSIESVDHLIFTAQWLWRSGFLFFLCLEFLEFCQFFCECAVTVLQILFPKRHKVCKAEHLLGTRVVPQQGLGAF
ncbi:unnamed protein product [Prunus armeniaca]